MQIRNPAYRERVAAALESATFVQALGIQIEGVGPGWVATAVALRPDFHMQQDGYVHAGVQATLADHAAGMAALTLATAEQRVLSVEFKINLLRPAVGDRLTCRAEVLKAGRSLTVVESAVSAWRGDASQLVAKATVTLAVLTP